MTSADNTPALPFGHGLSYTTFAHDALQVPGSADAASGFSARVRVRNTGTRAGADVVQLYARDRFASVTRPVAQLVGFARVELEPGEEATVRFQVPPTRLAFTGRDGRRVVEPGAIELWVGPSCAERETTAVLDVTGPVHEITAADRRIVDVTVER